MVRALMLLDRFTVYVKDGINYPTASHTNTDAQKGHLKGHYCQENNFVGKAHLFQEHSEEWERPLDSNGCTGELLPALRHLVGNAGGLVQQQAAKHGEQKVENLFH